MSDAFWPEHKSACQNDANHGGDRKATYGGLFNAAIVLRTKILAYQYRGGLGEAEIDVPCKAQALQQNLMQCKSTDADGACHQGTAIDQAVLKQGCNGDRQSHRE